MIGDLRGTRVECGGGRSFKMPSTRATRSNGPPQLAAVVNPIRASSKKKRKARQAGSTQRPRPISSTADATGDANDDHFLRLSRLARDLRDAAAEHPGSQGPLLEFLERHWAPRNDDEVPFRTTPTDKRLSDSYDEQDDYVEASKFSAAEQIVNQAIQFLVNIRSGLPVKLPVGLSPSATFVFSAMQHALVNAPYGFRGLLASLESLQTFLRQLFDASNKQCGEHKLTFVIVLQPRKTAHRISDIKCCYYLL